MLVLEARGRAGGRVEGLALSDGRRVELGGEVVGRVHRHYLGLAAELGLAFEPSYVAEPGEAAYDLADGVVRGESWLDDHDRSALARAEQALERIAAELDPADPWSHPEAARLDRCSVGDLLRDCAATPNAYRFAQLMSTATAGGSLELLSVLAEARAAAAAGARTTDYEAWEGLRLAGGASTLVEALAAPLGERLRYASPVRAIRLGRPCTLELAGGEELRSRAVVCAVPVEPLRGVEVDGVSEQRLRSLHRQRTLRASKAVIPLDGALWRAVGWSGLAVSERDVGGFWPQSGHVLSSLVGEGQLEALEASPAERQDLLVTATLERLLGEVPSAAVLWRHWGREPFTLGYTSQWSPGDLTSVGPLHGSHEPPLFFAGSDHWAAGYMEGAVATGRAAAGAVLGAERPVY